MTSSFKGGIQPGTVATDSKAAKLDKQCKEQAKVVFNELKILYPDLFFQKKLKTKQIPGGIGACSPDGGLWFYKNTLIAAFEAKKQNDKGNAIERWFKNNFICRLINSQMSYVTFCTGQGTHCSPDRLSYGAIVKALNVAHLDGFDRYTPNKNSGYLKKDGFTNQEIYDIIKEVIVSKINNEES